jgi:ATP-dependent helicase HrpA
MAINNAAALPIAAYRGEILAAIAANPAVVITAETGAGKSTQVPQFLVEAGYRVVVTQPRVLAAQRVAERVAEEMRVPLGGRVGYATGRGRACGPETEVLFCTDGLQLVRELAGHAKTGGRTVLVLDEVHEWNTNMEVLVAWVRQRIEGGEDLKVVLMSATLDAEGLASFFGGSPVISVPGRVFPVAHRHARADRLVAEAVSLAKQGKNVLVFQPGKREIEETVVQLKRELGTVALVLPLHGGLEKAEQRSCFRPAPRGQVKVIVATNVAQTSVTIPDIDAVVDSGLERRIELRDGIEGLCLLPTSQADCAQRAGRAGRVKVGEYVLCADTREQDRPAFPKAEILRARLDQTVLRLAVQGFDASALRFLHQPDAAEVTRARKSLVALGAMHEDGSVTQIGRRMARLPVSVQFARMMVEAERLGVVEQVATIAACLEQNGINDRSTEWKKLTAERKSDLLAQLDLYRAADRMRGQEFRANGIFRKDYDRARETRRKLLKACRDLRSGHRTYTSEAETREAALRACCAGMVDHLYKGEYGRYQNGEATARELARESVITGSPRWLVGLPFDISGKSRRGRSFTLNLVGMATAVDPAWLIEIAPQLASEETGLKPRFDAQQDSVVSTTRREFNGQQLDELVVPDPDHAEAPSVFANWLAAQMV